MTIHDMTRRDITGFCSCGEYVGGKTKWDHAADLRNREILAAERGLRELPALCARAASSLREVVESIPVTAKLGGGW